MVRLVGFLLAAAVVAGVFSGEMTLRSAATSQPPIRWSDLPLIGVFTLVAQPAVLGFQVWQGNLNAMRLGWVMFLGVGAYTATAGVAALVIAWRGPGLSPHAWLFLVLGLAVLGGVGLSRVVFRRHFASRAVRESA